MLRPLTLRTLGFFGAFVLVFGVAISEAQIEIKDVEEVKPLPRVQGVDRPPVGKKAADSYISKNSRAVASGSREHYMGVHIGHAIDSTAYEWGEESENEDIGRISAGVTYRMGEWVNSMDLLFRGEFQSYTVGDEKPLKLSLMPLILFPDSNSRFPLYFGGGAGIGIFFKQLDDESALSLDLQLLAGVRFFEVLESTGFFIETGLKNHLHLLSDGQVNAVYFSAGALFTF